MGFKILTPDPLIMKTGALIDYSVRVFGVNMHWQTLITAYNPPDSFVDQQLKGPYHFWQHRHTFIPQGQRTLMTDEVHYSLPIDFLGLAHRWLVRPQLEQIFNYRRTVIEDLLQK